MENNVSSILQSPEPPNCDVRLLFLATLSKAISDSEYSRPLIIDRMNDALHGEVVVTKDKFSKWIAPGTDMAMPLEYLPALLWAVGSADALNVLLQPICHRVIDERGQIVQEAGRLQLEAQSLQQRADRLFAQAQTDYPRATN